MQWMKDIKQIKKYLNMKHMGRDLNLSKIINKKYAKNHRHNINTLAFLKCNYKYKRRHTGYYHIKQKRQVRLTCYQHKRIKQKVPPYKGPQTDDTLITKRSPFYEHTKLDKFLRIFILIMEQTIPTNNNFKRNNKSDSSILVARLLTKIKAIKNTNTLLADVKVNMNANKEDKDVMNEEVDKDTDINVDISNIADETSHQQHNYDSVSTTPSTPMKFQSRKHHFIKTIKSTSSTAQSASSISLTTNSFLSSSPLIANYETCQWPAILRHYSCYNLLIHQQRYLYRYKTKHTHQPKHHALHKESLATSRLLNTNNSSSSTYNNTSCSCGSGYCSNTLRNKCSTKIGINKLVDQYVNATLNRSYTLSCLFLTLFIAFTIGVRTTAAGACWQTILDSGKCNEIFSLNISKNECCGANQEFAYTEREPTNVEYFFATAIGGGMECSPCLESCRNVSCGPNKKCVRRKGRPKCVCAPECGAARRKRKQREYSMQQVQHPQTEQQQHHTIPLISSHFREETEHVVDGGDIDYSSDLSAAIQSENVHTTSIEKPQQSRDTRSLSSETTNVNLGLEISKDSMDNSGLASSMERHLCKEYKKQNQRKLIHVHTHHSHGPLQHYTHHSQQQPPPKIKNQQPKGNRRLLITTNVEHTEKPTTRRLQIFSNVRTTNTRRQSRNSNKDGQHEDTDPSDYDEDKYEDSTNYNDAEADDVKKAKRKDKNSSNMSNSNNKNNRNDDSTRFLNQSPSRHKFKTNTKFNNNKSQNTSKNKNLHDEQATKILQHSRNTNARIRHSQQNGRHSENATQHRHHNHLHNNLNHHHRHQPKHHQQQQNHANHPQQQNQNRGRQKHSNNNNKQQQAIALKKPKNNKVYNITNTSNSNSNTNMNIAVVNEYGSDTHVISTDDVMSNNLHQSNTVTPTTTTITPALTSLAFPSSAATTINEFKTAPQETQLLLTSFPPFSFSSTTPANSTMSADDDAVAAASDYNHSHLTNHGSKIATSSILSFSSSSTSSLSYSRPSAITPRSSSESAVLTMSAKGEGVLHHDRKHSFEEIPTESTTTTAKKFNNNNNNDNIISALQMNLHNSQQQQNQRNLHQQQTALSDGISEQFNLFGFPNKQQQHMVTNEDNVRPLNPVCGTDGRTYNTECQLRKRACRTDNPSLKIAYRGHCRTRCNGVKCLNGFTCVEDQYSMPHCIACKIECPLDNSDVDETRAVCGADGKTYKSTCDINRMICKIGRSIGVAYSGPCREDQITCDDIYCGPKQVCLIDLLTHKPRCTSCRYKCSRKRRPSNLRFEEGKICGFNNRTYNSWCEMRKDSCTTGFYIDVKHPGECH